MSSLERDMDGEFVVFSGADEFTNNHSLFYSSVSEHTSISEDEPFVETFVKERQLLQPASPLNIEDEISEAIMHSQIHDDCNLAALELTVVPSELRLETLKWLDLSQNKLVHLPEEIFVYPCCQQLTCLKINSNNLERLPESLFYLPKLQTLMLNGNRLVSLPQIDPCKKFLPCLERVELEHNELNEFPMIFFEYCELLSDVLLSQNVEMFDQTLSYQRFANCLLARLWKNGQKCTQTVLRIDNKPPIVEQIAAEDWPMNFPWLSVSLNRIYPDKIIPFMFIGSLRTAQTVSVYRHCDIKYVLTIGREMDVKIVPGMVHKVILFDDFPGEDLAILFTEAFQFIDQARKTNCGVLIHCFAGLSRSVAVAAAYIMKELHLTYEEAMTIITRVRPSAQPNEGFVRTLKRCEKELINGVY